ncbi:MAG: hydantoinase/oxoprolinase family protein, partial [Acidobacteria bacterium]|nr:hydantoinase/oxoprolinase family protein [Acidobacteriota bacterium]
GMERALRVVSVERGFDPRGLTLVSFGGAGGLHAVALARSLKIPRVIVPRRPGALSALGAIISDVIKDSSRTVMLEATAESAAQLERAWAEMERAARTTLRREGFADERQRHERSVTARYKGQSFELEIRATKRASLSAAFHRAHSARYGYAQTENAVEVVSARLRSKGLVERVKSGRLPGAKAGPPAPPPQRRAIVHFDDGRKHIAVYAREELPAGARLTTPCVVTEYSSTTLIPSETRAHVDADGNLIIEL